MNRLYFTILAGMLTANSMLAQVSILGGGFNATGVSNDGVAVGYYEENGSFYLWDTPKGTTTPIGGVTAGNGIGGWGSSSADGLYISGDAKHFVDISQNLERTTVKEKYNFTKLINTKDSRIWAIGNTDENNGIVANSGNNGKNWQQLSLYDKLGQAITLPKLTAGCFLTNTVGLLAGQDGFYLVTVDGSNWSEEYPKPGGKDQVKVYHDILFRGTTDGVATAELTNGEGAVYYSPNGAESWEKATGLVDQHPIHVCHTSKAFFLITREGAIYISDKGAEWTLSYQAKSQLNDIAFRNDKSGIAVGNDGTILLTEDGGQSWNSANNATTDWNSIAWKNDKDVYISGEKDVIYHSSDAGKTWKQLNEKMAMPSESIHDIYANGSLLVTCGTNGNFYHQYFGGKLELAEMSRYNTSTKTWQSLGNNGSNNGTSSSNGYFISADGNTVVGNAYTIVNPLSLDSKSIAEASVWTEKEGLVSLGSKFGNLGRSSRADAVSKDGKVVVGWQDQKGPWFSSIWKKQEDGKWSEGKPILLDPAKGETENNIMPWCLAVSPNGKWVGGKGFTGAAGPLAADIPTKRNNEPWIWSEETGVTFLGMLDNAPATDGFVGYVKAINNAGTLAVGFFVTSKVVPSFNMYPFIWTKEKGIQDLNEYVKNELKGNLDGIFLASALSLSENEQYIAGWGLKGQDVCGAVIDLTGNATGNELPNSALSEARIYLDSMSNILYINLGEKSSSVHITLYDMQGTLVKSQETAASSTSLSVGDMPSGLYILQLVSNDGMLRQTQKIQINH